MTARLVAGHWLRVAMYQGRLLAWRNPSTGTDEPETGWVALGAGAAVPDDLIETGLVRAGVGVGRHNASGACHGQFSYLSVIGVPAAA